MKIKAAVVEEKGGPFVIKDNIELAPLHPDDVQVHRVASGICHSDEALRKGDAIIGYPIVLGHEGSGIVEKVGSNVQSLKVGDHVVLS
ncbi:alcohol dehydrogenase catalytic domain-containing protein, partial [Latilactobacillus sakei]|uniref:alcohol dehydrogenase catalytic domain-containing protein n=1 Tax=Latilactobacillus sakei TaxID=1599 RepID=UPI003F53D3C8